MITNNANDGPPYLGFSFNANSYPYQPVSNLKTVSPWATYYLIQLNIDWTTPVGKVVTYDNALQKSPTTIPPGTSTWMDANGQMTILTHIRGSFDYYWSYVYQWVPPDATPSCSYTLSTGSASPGAGAGNNSFNVTAATGRTGTATSNAPTWLTTSSSGNGNGTVNYAVTANTSTSSRTGIITVGGQTSAGAQTFTVTQAGTGGGSTATGNFTFNGFASTSGLTLVGNAATASTSDGTVLRLTPALSEPDWRRIQHDACHARKQCHFQHPVPVPFFECRRNETG